VEEEKDEYEERRKRGWKKTRT